MTLLPAFDAFAERYERGEPCVLWTRSIADLDTPVSAMLKLAGPQRMSFLLESVQGGETRGRYSIIGMKPDLLWRCREGKPEINRSARFDLHAFEPDQGDALGALRRLISSIRMSLPADVPPMAVGLFGYLGYDMVRLIEPIGEAKPDSLNLPDALLMRPTITAVFDSVKNEIIIVTPVWPESGISARAAYARAGERLSDALADLHRPLPAVAAPTDLPPSGEPQSNTTHADYLAMVERCKEYIRAGDAFQIVPSQRFRTPFPLPPFALYRTLRRINPSPFLYFLDLDTFSVVGSSPEILVRLRDKHVTIRPIAGTRPRGATPEEDAALATELLADPKERAEHLMLVDLGRNDVGRVAKIGSVKVVEQYSIERYSHVMHIVSHVDGEIDPLHDALDALLAGFPAGTLSGAPKVRAMQIINELEREKRGLYAGGVGYFAADGSMDTCIVLRTAVIKDGTMYVQAGGGVVADSDPESEFQETVNKAKALFRAAAEAIAMAGEPSRGQ
ncbi:MAG: anthranilate synthase component I [Alphaproteobacteria bacterium]|nr:anthranilate synthase component I [Alphaproteobacteria bacterium]